MTYTGQQVALLTQLVGAVSRHKIYKRSPVVNETNTTHKQVTNQKRKADLLLRATVMSFNNFLVIK